MTAAQFADEIEGMTPTGIKNCWVSATAGYGARFEAEKVEITRTEWPTGRPSYLATVPTANARAELIGLGMDTAGASELLRCAAAAGSASCTRHDIADLPRRAALAARTGSWDAWGALSPIPGSGFWIFS
jgi:hypothetical protein